MKFINDILFNNDMANSFSILDGQKLWNSSEIKNRALKLKGQLIKKGARILEPVALVSENSSSFAVGLFGILEAGGTVVFIDPQLPIKRVENILEELNIKYVCASGNRPEQLMKDMNNNELIVLNENEWDGELCGHEIMYKSVKDPVFILFSSGTSGKPKGIVHSHKSILNNVDAILNYMNPSKDDCFYLAKTMAHSSSIVAELLVGVQIGAKLIIKNPVVSPKKIINRLIEYKATILFLNPTLLKLINLTKKEETSTNLRLIYTCGAPVDKETVMETERLFMPARVLNLYGCTEAGPRVTAQRYEMETNYGFAGYPIKGVELKIVDAEGGICSANQSGTIMIKTTSMMLEYLNNKEATEKKIINGWINSGDNGYLNEEGELFVIGRADDMIIRGSHNVEPSHIESVISKMPAIKECLVFGVKKTIGGEKIICAAVSDEIVNIDSVIQWCMPYLAAYEWPQEIVIWNKIPKTFSGKVSRKLAIEKYLSEKGENVGEQ